MRNSLKTQMMNINKQKTMKRITQIFRMLLGVVALILTALIAIGRLAWRDIRSWWKNRSKSFRCSVVTIVILIFGCIVAREAYDIYDDAYGRDYYWDRELSDNITLRSFCDNKWKVYDDVAEKYTTPRLNWVVEMPDNDSLAVYALPNRRGYLSVNTGRIIIDAESNNYRKAWVFSEGLAAVMKDGKIGFINARNEVVIPFQFDFPTDEECVRECGYLFHDGYCAMTNADGDWGLIDKSGRWVVAPAYEEIWTPDNGYRVIIKDGKYGVLDSACSVLYPAEYQHLCVVSDGFVLTRDGRMWQVDYEGEIVKPFMYENTYYLNYPIGYNDCGDIEYAFADYVKYEILDRYGVMNRITGRPVTPAIYSDINMLSAELFEVQHPESYDWYLVNTGGVAVK